MKNPYCEESRCYTECEKCGHNAYINEMVKQIRAEEREKVINDIRDWLHRAFDKQNNAESVFVPSIVLNEMIFVLLDNYIESHKLTIYVTDNNVVKMEQK